METEDLTQERIAINQSRFREANERIELAADKMQLVGPVPFICECANRACAEIVRLSIEGYEEVRDNPRLFFTAPGHEQLALNAGAGVVVGEGDGYVLVEKVGVAGQVAEDNYREINESD
jgi:hypothetical protein